MRVAVGILLDTAGRALITRRAFHRSGGGFWEFPGGKAEPGELIETALIREIQEEVGVVLLDYEALGTISSPNAMTLHVFFCRSWQGEACACEDQLDLSWVAWASLKDYALLPANHAILALVEASGYVARQ